MRAALRCVSKVLAASRFVQHASAEFIAAFSGDVSLLGVADFPAQKREVLTLTHADAIMQWIWHTRMQHFCRLIPKPQCKPMYDEVAVPAGRIISLHLE